MSYDRSRRRTWWSRLLGRTGGPPRPGRRFGLRVEGLEDRLAPATFAEAGSQLNLDLAAYELATIASNGTNYQVSLAGGAWTGTDSANVTGNGTATLNVTSAGLAAFTKLAFTDSGANTRVVFGNSGANAYSDDVEITLDSAPSNTAPDFAGATTFAGSSSLTANVQGRILLNADSLTTVNGNIRLNATVATGAAP